MSVLGTLSRREALATTRGSLCWSLCAEFAAFTGAMLLWTLHTHEGSQQSLSGLYSRIITMSLAVFVIFATMRLFTEERSAGTLETLLTAPVMDCQVVLSKFIGAYFMTICAILTSLAGFVAYTELAAPAPVYSRTCLAGALVMLAMHAAAWVAIGTFAALTSRSQAVAAAVASLFIIPYGLIVSGYVSSIFTSFKPEYMMSLNITRISVLGQADVRPIVFALTIAALFLFIATRALETRRWRD